MLPRMDVLIYQDYIHNNGALHRSLCRYFGTDNVGFCDAADIVEGALDSRLRLFVMPGGADLYYAEKLNGAGNEAIRKYVQNGGSYLGLCAGSYYGCFALDWASGTEHEIRGGRELAFFTGHAVGPLYDLIEDGDINKSWQAAPEIRWDDGQDTFETPVFYEGGPIFIPQGNQSTVTILARYVTLPGQPAALIECRVGAGKALLCSFHPESCGDDLARRFYTVHNASYEWNALIARTLQPYDTLVRQLWSKILERCLS